MVHPGQGTARDSAGEKLYHITWAQDADGALSVRASLNRASLRPWCNSSGRFLTSRENVADWNSPDCSCVCLSRCNHEMADVSCRCVIKPGFDACRWPAGARWKMMWLAAMLTPQLQAVAQLGRPSSGQI